MFLSKIKTNLIKYRILNISDEREGTKNTKKMVGLLGKLVSTWESGAEIYEGTVKSREKPLNSAVFIGGKLYSILLWIKTLFHYDHCKKTNFFATH